MRASLKAESDSRSNVTSRKSLRRMAIESVVVGGRVRGTRRLDGGVRQSPPAHRKLPVQETGKVMSEGSVIVPSRMREMFGLETERDVKMVSRYIGRIACHVKVGHIATYQGTQKNSKNIRI